MAVRDRAGATAEPIVVSPRTARQMLDIGKTKLFSLIKNNELVSVKLGKSRRITVDSIRKLAGSA